MSAAPTITDTTRSCAKLSQPRAKATGTLRSAAKRSPSMAIITGRLRRNSTHGPSGTATAAPTASPAAASIDTAAGPACRTRIAIRANASNANQVPNVLTAYAVQSQPNSRPSALAIPCVPTVSIQADGVDGTGGRLARRRLARCLGTAAPTASRGAAGGSLPTDPTACAGPSDDAFERDDRGWARPPLR